MCRVLLCFVVAVSLSMHACTGRYLMSLIDDPEAGRPSNQYPPKVITEDVSSQTGVDQTSVGAVIQHSPFRSLFKEETTTAAGQVLLIAHPKDGLQQKDQNNNLVEGMGRVLMGQIKEKKMEEKEDNNTTNNNNVGEESKEANYSGDDAAEEGSGVVAMDYAQPHRKPPIHNEKS